MVSGLRGEDMAVRLKYAGIKNLKHQPTLQEALEASLSNLKANETLYILPTYTALLELKKLLQEKGLVESAWGEDTT